MDEQRRASEISDCYLGRRPSNIYASRRGTAEIVTVESSEGPKALEIIRDDRSSYHTAASADEDGVRAGREGSAERTHEEGAGKEMSSMLRWVSAFFK